MQTKLKARYVTRELLGISTMAVALCWSAGRMDWWEAWAAIAVTTSWTVATAVLLLGFRPDLLAERLGPRKGSKLWDTMIMSMLGVAQLVRYIIAGLDKRLNWTGTFPIAYQITGLILCILGYATFIWAMASNPYFSQIVRIQVERGHTIASSGPYRYIRHPSYAGAILCEIAVAVLLSSWWALIIGIFNVGLLTLRTSLEDRALRSELAGYNEYSRRVRYRLIPGLW
jgi:protein-S-isoprenylcysteine O-methyltransferase Ste14